MARSRPSREALAALFAPRNVALVGASDRSPWSNSIFARCGDYGHRGKLFAVNRGGGAAHGLPGFRAIAEIPEPVDTAFIFVPAAAVAEALRDAAAAGVRHAVVLSSGFAEAGAEGAALQARLAEVADDAGVTMLGPNSLGFANFGGEAFCTSIRSRLPVPSGGLALVSQSGALVNELAKWAHAQGIGLSFFCATGNEAQIGIADVLDFLVDDAATRAIAIYAEGIADPERFEAAAARALAMRKPVVVLKIGRGPVSAEVARAHTGSEVGDDAAFDALCRRLGIARAVSLEELVASADFLGRIGPIDPPRVAMASVSGGMCAIYADLAAIHGLALPPFADATCAALAEVLPSFAARLNPLDVTGISLQQPAMWRDVVAALARDPGFGLAVTCHNIPNTALERQALDPTFAAIAEGYRLAGMPPAILSASLQDMGASQAALREELGFDIVLPSIELGVRALAHLQRWSERVLATG